jgi:general stress protein YciG
MGRKAMPAEMRSFSKDSSLAAKARRKGGALVPNVKPLVLSDPELATAAGAKGGHASRGGKGKCIGKPGRCDSSHLPGAATKQHVARWRVATSGLRVT